MKHRAGNGTRTRDILLGNNALISAPIEIQFKPPWNFFPIHTTRIDHFSIAFEVGFDQGELMCFSIAFYDESGDLSIAGGSTDGSWRELIAEYMERINHARWLAEVEQESGLPRYMRLNDEYRSWGQEYYQHRFKDPNYKIPPACLVCGKRSSFLVDHVCRDCHEHRGCHS